MDRREALGLSLAGIAATIIPLSAAAGPSDEPLVLEARAGTQRLVPAPAAETAIWGYGGTTPGPLLRIKLGQSIKARLVNRLTQPTTITWHGVRISNAMDGVGGLTQTPVKPGEHFHYTFTPPDSGFYWYHPHVWPNGAEQTARGLYGILLVDEREPPPVDRDLLVVIDDWSLDEKAQIKSDFLGRATAAGSGRIGPLVTLGAQPIPSKETFRPGSRVRLRLLNACSARISVVAVVDARVTVVAVDGQPSEIFQPMGNSVPIGPGSRFELMVDLPNEAGKEVNVALRGDGEPDKILLVAKTMGEPVASHGPVARLPVNPRLPTRIPLERSLRKTIVIGSREASMGAPDNASAAAFWTIDGQASNGQSAKPLFSVKRGGVVTLTFVNKTVAIQQMHVHGHVWRLLHDLDDGWDPYWRDSVLLAPGRTKHVAFIADNPGKWALVSAILDRQETGLAGWFAVT